VARIIKLATAVKVVQPKAVESHTQNESIDLFAAALLASALTISVPPTAQKMIRRKAAGVGTGGPGGIGQESEILMDWRQTCAYPRGWHGHRRYTSRGMLKRVYPIGDVKRSL